MLKKIRKEAFNWLSDIYDLQTQKEVKNLLDGDPKLLYDAFYTDIEFGTSGLRGIMGVGPNRINRYTFGKIILGFARYLKKKFPSELISVVIGYDTRNKSEFFAQISSKIFSSCGIKVYLFDRFCPTPELSFAIRNLKAKSGVMVTASHNPREYNGCKLYFEDGGQVTSPYEEDIMREIKKISFEEISFESKPSLISFIGKEMDEKFIDVSIKHSIFSLKEQKKELKILFTPLHGAAINIAPMAFKRAGFLDFHLLKEQASPDGNFSTLLFPNPEEKSSFELALKYAKRNPVDLILASDPDADRLGVGIYGDQDEVILLNGNQTNTLLTFFLLEKYQKQNLLNANCFIATTKVSSDIFFEMAKFFGVDSKVSFTGFKWIAAMVSKAKKHEKFIGGGEESFGFMVGDFIRDKDAITSMLLMAEIASELKSEGSSLYEKLLEIYIKLGFYYDYSISKVYKEEEGSLRIQEIMKDYRENPPFELANSKVVEIEDYLLRKTTNLIANTQIDLDSPISNLLIYRLEDGSKIAIRPSGTEPKIKFYFNLKEILESKTHYRDLIKKMEKKVFKISEELKI